MASSNQGGSGQNQQGGGKQSQGNQDQSQDQDSQRNERGMANSGQAGQTGSSSMGVRVTFLATKPKTQSAPVPGVLLPPEALTQREGTNSVFVVTDGHAQLRTVKLGADVGKSRLVTEGLKAGETVVVSPPAELKSGSTVVNKDKE